MEKKNDRKEGNQYDKIVMENIELQKAQQKINKQKQQK